MTWLKVGLVVLGLASLSGCVVYPYGGYGGGYYAGGVYYSGGGYHHRDRHYHRRYDHYGYR